MLMRTLAKLGSVVLGAMATAIPASVAVSALATPVAAQEVARLALSDAAGVTASELESAVITLVQELRAAGYSDLQIATILGGQLKDVATDLPASQQRALVLNVLAILSSVLQGATVAALQVAFIEGYGPIDAPVFLATEVPPSLLSPY